MISKNINRVIVVYLYKVPTVMNIDDLNIKMKVKIPECW